MSGTYRGRYGVDRQAEPLRSARAATRRQDAGGVGATPRVALTGPARVLALQGVVGNRAVAQGLQRSVMGKRLRTLSQVKDPVALFVKGDFSLGYTPPVLNEHRMEESTSKHEAHARICRPETEEVSGGTGPKSIRVVAEPTNFITSDQDLLIGPPWERHVAQDQLNTALGGSEPRVKDPDWKEGGTLEIVGKDNDPRELQRQVRAHEDVHAVDNLDVARTVLVPWDRALADAARQGSVFHGSSREDAEKAMYASVGGTPESKVDELVTRWYEKSDTFHRTPQGKTNVDDVSLFEREPSVWRPFGWTKKVRVRLTVP